jgi:outer membrane protein insertion porin family
LNPQGQLTTDEGNLFTQKTYGASVFATAPLSEFLPKRAFSRLSRIGLTYQFSSTSITDPPVNQSADLTQRVPVIFAQPNIITSRITPTFVYDSRQPSANGIDTLRGTQISASFAFSGLGGDVRTYQPSITYTNFIPVRRKRSQNAEVFGFRIQAGTIGSFGITDNIRNANSLAFVGGVPLYERYFLGSEYDLRGYTSRAIGPIAPYDSFITSRNVRIASNVSGTPMIPAALSSDIINELTPFGTFTGATGANAAALNKDFRFIGGDTQLLGNFEYRIPIFGPVSLAAFADVGTVFNLRKTGIQTINSEFLDDDTFVGAGHLDRSSFAKQSGSRRQIRKFVAVQRPITDDSGVQKSFLPDGGLPDQPAG